MAQPPPKSSSRSTTSHGTREEEKKSHSKPKDLSHVPCKFFRAGQCTAGASCPFSHTVAEPGQPKQVCQWFLSGNCRFAHKCALAHIHPGEPMSMDRKNKKAAQQAMQQQQAQEGGPPATGSTGKERDRSQQQNKRDREKDKDKDKDKDKERSGRRERPSGGTRTGSRPPRDRASGSEKRRDSTSTAQGDEPPANGMTSSVATLRPPIRIGKGPTTSASVTAPPVLRDTNATATMASLKTSNESEASSTGEKPSYASVTLEHFQAQSHSRQATITPASEALALSDYSKTPSATVHDLPPSTTSLSSPKHEILDSPTSSVYPMSSRAREGASSRERMRNDNSASPPLSRADAPAGRFGPVGSPPRAGFANGSPSGSTGTSRGALSSLFASLSMNPTSNPNAYTSPPQQHQAAAVTPQKDDLGPSSITSQSSLHAHMNTNLLGTSPFSMPGSRSLFMPLSSSQTSQSNIPAYLAGGQGPLNVGVPASFAGSRAVGWGIGSEARRPSLPGHNQRPSLGAASLRSGKLDESAFEEENEDIEAEEFLPSSLSDLLTKEERERRFSRGGAIRPTKDSLLATEGLNTPVEDDEVWERTVRQRPNAADQLPPDNSNAFSRSVPATNLIGQVRSLWDRDKTTSNTNPGLAGTTSGGMSRTTVTGGIAQDMFGGVSGSYGPSPSMLSSSVMSNASNAFLQSSRLGAGDVHSSHKPLVNDLQVGSYNPSSMLYQKQQQMSHAAHQHHSSISGFPSGLNTRNGTQGVTSSTAGGYSMYSRPPDLTAENKSGLASMYGQRTSQQMQQRPTMTTQNASTHANANDSLTGLRHEPGQSLPRGLGAGLSRIHFVPAGSLGSTVGSPPPASGFGSTNPVASPPYGNFHLNMAGSGRGEPNDLDGTYPGATQKSNYGSGLTARLMATGVNSQPPPSQGSYPLDATQGNGRTGAMSIHNVRNQHSTWGSGAVTGQDDVDVDEGTLFNMD